VDPVELRGEEIRGDHGAEAIEESVNTATARLALDVGLSEVVKTARAAGIRSPLSPVPRSRWAASR